MRFGVLSATARPYSKEITMFEPQHVSTLGNEWGPAHLRADAVLPEIEMLDRPDDN